MTTLPAIAPLSAHLIASEMVALCDSVSAELEPVGRWIGSNGVGAEVTRLDVADLTSVRIAATVVLDETFEGAFDAGLVRWAPDGALVSA